MCTIGPGSSGPGVLRRMILAGMDVARLNFSHGSYDDHARALARIRRISRALKRPVAIMQDLPGPKIRTGEMGSGPAPIRKGKNLVITGRDVPGNSERVSVNFPSFIKKARPGTVILIDDGKIRLRVTAVDRRKKEVRCRVLEGGLLKARKGVNLPDTDLELDALTGEDRKCLAFGLSLGVDLVALSFVGSARDVHVARRFMVSRGCSVPIIAKIERRRALENLDAILEAADGAMVARGDLGVETELEEVPLLQKRIIRSCVTMGKPVITATQMLESMVESFSPTRAEVADVANAVLDGTDALMLSEETAVGRFPVECVRTMDKIALKTEGAADHEKFLVDERIKGKTIQEAVTNGANLAAADVKARAVIACTNTGKTARLVARHRPGHPVIGASPCPNTVNQLCVTRGVYPVKMKKVNSTDGMVREAEKAALKTGLVKRGDTVVITAGYPETNLIKVLAVG